MAMKMTGVCFTSGPHLFPLSPIFFVFLLFPNIPAMWFEPLFPLLGILLSSRGYLLGLQLSNDILKITFQTTQSIPLYPFALC